MGFSSVFAMQNIIFKKIPTLRIKYYCFTDWPTLFFSAVLPVDQKINLVSPNQIIFLELKIQMSRQ